MLSTILHTYPTIALLRIHPYIIHHKHTYVGSTVQCKIKGTVQWDFGPPFLCWFIRILGWKKNLTRWGMIFREVMIFYWLAGVWYSREIDLLGYDTPGRWTHMGNDTLERLKNSNNSANFILTKIGQWPRGFELWKQLEVEHLVGPSL